jgi:hypothetical protein
MALAPRQIQWAPSDNFIGLKGFKGAGASPAAVQSSSGPIAAQVQAEKAGFQGATRTKIRYGPYTLPSTLTKNAQYMLEKEAGMYDGFAANMKMPCQDCTIIRFQAGLEYPNGTVANVDTGAWLHHMVMTTSAGKDTVCPMEPQRIFSSGNERTVTGFVVGNNFTTNEKVGAYVGPTDKFSMIIELMVCILPSLFYQFEGLN